MKRKVIFLIIRMNNMPVSYSVVSITPVEIITITDFDLKLVLVDRNSSKTKEGKENCRLAY